jgi:hypothetical protein
VTIAAGERHSGFDVSAFGRYDMTDAVLTDIEKRDLVALRPIA